MGIKEKEGGEGNREEGKAGNRDLRGHRNSRMHLPSVGSSHPLPIQEIGHCGPDKLRCTAELRFTPVCLIRSPCLRSHTMQFCS